MSEQAQQLIEENLKTKNPVLDLANCELLGGEDELFALLKDATHLQTLNFSQIWYEYNPKKQGWITRESQNKDGLNVLYQIPSYLPPNLQELCLGGNDKEGQIDDITPLKNCKSLQVLDLSCNKIRDLDPLVKLPHLNTLDISYNQVQSSEPIKSLTKLSMLILSGNEIQDIDFIYSLINLEFLDLRVNEIKSIESIRPLNKLRCIDLSDNEIQHIAPIQSLTNLQKLYLESNSIQDITIIQHLESLQYLSLDHNQIQHIEPIQKLKNLHFLGLLQNPIQDTSPIKALYNLRSLYIEPTKIATPPPFWLAQLHAGKDKLGNLIMHKELPEIDKIWHFLSSGASANKKLGAQLAKSQGWTNEEVDMYQKLAKTYL